MDTKALGVVLLVVGIILLAAGFNEYGAFGSKVSRALGAGPSIKVLFLFIAGGVCTALGLMRTLKK